MVFISTPVPCHVKSLAERRQPSKLERLVRPGDRPRSGIERRVGAVPRRAEDRAFGDLHALNGEFYQRLGEGKGALQIRISLLAQEFSCNECTDLVEMPERGKQMRFAFRGGRASRCQEW